MHIGPLRGAHANESSLFLPLQLIAALKICLRSLARRPIGSDLCWEVDNEPIPADAAARLASCVHDYVEGRLTIVSVLEPGPPTSTLSFRNGGLYNKIVSSEMGHRRLEGTLLHGVHP